MSHAKNKVNWCLNKAKKELREGKQHRGLVKVEVDLEKAREHLTKAEHNLKVTLYLQKGGFTDWCSSSLFYVIYHCFLAILVKYGYETRNQECTFALIASLIEDKKITLIQEDLEKVSMLNLKETQESPDTVVSIREDYQYSTKVSLENKEYQELLQLAKRILDKTKVALEM
ncbi:TPA: HEPN domain-containing protein [Candidatus Woesearchaeota archaeon]|nr:HEPN domain-containing protein [Candidatus Woesearchaeota archaeon]